MFDVLCVHIFMRNSVIPNFFEKSVAQGRGLAISWKLELRVFIHNGDGTKIERKRGSKT